MVHEWEVEIRCRRGRVKESVSVIALLVTCVDSRWERKNV